MAAGEERPRVLILGAGFAGLWAARRLAGTPVDITLLDRNNFHTFFPLLYQVGAAELDATDIAQPVRRLIRGQRNVRFLMARAEALDAARRVVGTDRGEHGYDHLLIGTGSVSHFFGVPGAAEHAFPLRTMEEGLAQRNHVLSRFEKAVHLEDPRARRKALRFVIVGGGPTGVEFAGALAELLFGPLAKDHPALAPHFSVVLLEAQDRLLGAMPDRLGRYAAERLGAMGVQVRTGAAVERVEAGSVLLAGGEDLPTETVTWTAGVRGDPDAEAWGLPVGPGGRVRVRPTLEVEGLDRIWAGGDLAYLEQDGEALPMIAPVAIQQGEHAAEGILRRLEGRDPEPFAYRDRGMLATIGRNKAVAHVFGRAFTGFPAWLLWLGIHIVKLIGFRNRIVVLVNWAWDYFFFERAVRLILPRGRAPRGEGGGPERESGPPVRGDPEPSG